MGRQKRAAKFFKPLIIIGYLPLIALCWALPKLWSDPYQKPIEKLAPLLYPSFSGSS